MKEIEILRKLTEILTDGKSKESVIILKELVEDWRDDKLESWKSKKEEE